MKDARGEAKVGLMAAVINQMPSQKIHDAPWPGCGKNELCQPIWDKMSQIKPG